VVNLFNGQDGKTSVSAAGMVEKLLVAKLIAEWMLQAGGFQAVINWLDGQC
jgi:hypothetical protein